MGKKRKFLVKNIPPKTTPPFSRDFPFTHLTQPLNPNPLPANKINQLTNVNFPRLQIPFPPAFSIIILTFPPWPPRVSHKLIIPLCKSFSCYNTFM